VPAKSRKTASKRSLAAPPRRLRKTTQKLWDAWVFAAVESELALSSWTKAAQDLKADAFAAYQFTLDREEQAAAALAAAFNPGMRLNVGDSRA
jgi:hypothetical protein